MQNTWKQAFRFLFLTSGVYGCFLVSAVYHEKILKVQYKGYTRNQIFQQPFAFVLFPQFVSAVIGFIITSFQSNYTQIPFKKYLKIGVLINFTCYTYNSSIISASFPSVVMAKSCSLLSVILVGVFCSRVKEKSLKLGKDKVLIGILACSGMFIFNYYSKSQNNNTQNHPIGLSSLVFLILSLIGDGFLPDFQAQIKSQYKPSSYHMYYNTNKCVALVSFIFLLVTFRIGYIFNFMIEHPDFLSDMTILSILHSIGQLFIYQMVKSFKQHIPAFVVAVRKCFTVIVNLIWFKHQVNNTQFVAILLVFIAVISEVYTNNCKKQPQCSNKEIPETDPLKVDDDLEAQIQNQLRGYQYSTQKKTSY